MIVNKLRGTSNLEKVLICTPQMIKNILAEANKASILNENIYYEVFAAEDNLVSAPLSLPTVHSNSSEDVNVTLTLNDVTRHTSWNKHLCYMPF